MNIILNGQGPEPPTTMYVSGGTTRLIEIMKRFCKQKYVNLYVVSSEGVCNTFKRNNIRAKYFPIPYFLKNATSYNKLLIDSVLRTIFVCFYSLPVNDGIIYSASDFIWDVLPAFVWKLRNKNVKWIQMIHHSYSSPFRRKGNFFNNLLGYLSQRISFLLIRCLADAVLVYDSLEGKQIEEHLKKMGYKAYKIFKVQNGVNFSIIKKFSKTEKRYDACFIGRLAESKGIFDIVTIWRLVCNKKEGASLVIIGEGSENIKEKLKRRIYELHLEKNIILTGLLEGEKLYKKITSCKICVHPSYEEGWGITICEAMACGLPVVAWDLPVYKKIYPAGIIKIPIGNLEKFAEGILNLLDDEQLYEKLSKDAIQIASKYDWDKIAEEELEIHLMIHDEK